MPVDVRILIRLDRRPPSDEMKEWNRQLLGHFKDDFFLDDKPLVTLEGWEYDIIEEYPQSTWLESHWAHNYYGEGYERGDFSLIIQYIDTLQEMIPAGVIYYGPDSVDGIELFRDQRQGLKDHWDQVGNVPYRSRMSVNRTIFPTPTPEYSDYLKPLEAEEMTVENQSIFESDGSIRTDSFRCKHALDELAISRTFSITWKTLLCLLMAGVGVYFFRQIAEGYLFLFAFPMELPPRAGEIKAARELGRMLFWTPIPISAGIWLFLISAKFNIRDGYSLRSPVGISLIILQGLALVATMLDAWSTIALISRFGIDGEAHPGIASFCYMFGRASGTIFGKAFQWMCMQFIIVAISVRWRIVILVIYVAAGLLASVWNFQQVAEFG